MENDKPSLTRGLDAILKLNNISASENEASHPQDKFLEVSIHDLFAGQYQPRKHFAAEDLNKLSASIKEQGIIQPLIVRKALDNRYEIIAGERRWRAAKMADLATVPVVLREIEDDVAAAFSLVENIQRKDLNPLEEAVALQRLQNEFDMSHDDIAQAVGRSRTAVTNILRLLTLSEEAKNCLLSESISMGHARALITLDHDQQAEICQMIIKKDLSVRQTEERVRKIDTPASSHTEKPNSETILHDLSQKIGDSLKVGSTIKKMATGHYKIQLSVKSLEALEALVRRLQQ